MQPLRLTKQEIRQLLEDKELPLIVRGTNSFNIPAPTVMIKGWKNNFLTACVSFNGKFKIYGHFEISWHLAERLALNEIVMTINAEDLFN